jgi:hypothetical protein
MTKRERKQMEQVAQTLEFAADMSQIQGPTALVNVRLRAAQVRLLAKIVDEALAEYDKGEEAAANV